MSSEILVIPFHGQGHLLPCAELCIHLADRNYKITLVIQSNILPSISSSLRNHPLIEILPLSPIKNTDTSVAPQQHHPFPPTDQISEPFADLLSQKFNGSDSPPPVCIIVDIMMSWIKEIVEKFKIPTVSFFTSGACSAAMEFAVWKLRPVNPKPGETLTLPGLPEDLSLTFSDLNQADRPPPSHNSAGGQPPPPHGFAGGHPPPPHGFAGGHPPPPHGFAGGHPDGGHRPPPNHHGGRPPWVGEMEGSIALLMNTCDDLERPFIDYVARETGKPVFGVGPLLPAQFWKSPDSVVHDGEIRSQRESNVSEKEVQDWLDSKPRGSVIYVAFGTEVGPTDDELEELSASLAESNRSFIWAIQRGRHGPPGHPGPAPGGDLEKDGFIEELASRAEDRGLIIRGWAPQLLILSHPSTAGFVSHCGWNSTVEALGRGVPLLAWPIRGDQHYNAKLVVSHLKVGFKIRPADGYTNIKKKDILKGIEKLMGDEEPRKRAAALRSLFAGGFPACSSASLDAFRDFIQGSCEQE
ncbi:putative UDP-glucosyl transferase 73B6 [Tasmannia lanceolata]|uniref:putative UDP-glucosyl transferase 73B6 n=1 Tax=Tasmannia lanceolata TaxID=3420 RepID=UPI004064104F